MWVLETQGILCEWWEPQGGSLWVVGTGSCEWWELGVSHVSGGNPVGFMWVVGTQGGPM